MSDWKVDPDARRRLLQLQKVGANKKCVDCHAPNPQWASPKFGIFICLECAGTHRSLGVHISFVRSITMDQFKPEELVRMEKGGNQQFNDYMSQHGIDLNLPPKVKYDNLIAEDYKQKLTCEVEGTDFVEPEHPGFDPSSLSASGPHSACSSNNSSANIDSRSEGTPVENRRSNAPQLPNEQREKNEAYFASLGKKNESRPDHLPPSQGGKYQGFGNTPNNNQSSSSSENLNSNTLNLENIQNDPIGTLSRGWSLFSSAITKSFDDVTETVIKPGMEQWQSGELSEETKRAAAQFGQKFQETSTYGIQAFQQFTKNLQDQYVNPGTDMNDVQYSNANATNNDNNDSSYHDASTQDREESNKKHSEDNWDDF
ncbi:GTPase-activating protein GCS1 NDAI_0H03880 [Naumovozyma dairenensis CBS 421]|uniref:Arf-GAP domain-containing protein n=1 Tax=Naumovozyma dairenensis (strain ATCC 10597 / BCRC 20456 / CBS 421 / NBRC 0211 / NRRL Y-12639) TaxID=1071378 RepID=G0WFK0_NAUDC|nr:hypothetical protein NDAI_0H03880 [Naumovozyma dairenensis CBS 421]CCD26561.1 hypothetical protein NDAI_0H03880 [Naumovozyma dairenensis CBS 421]